MDFLNLIRYKNLLFIAFFQWAIFYCIISPILTTFGLDTANTIDGLNLLLLIGSTVFICAGGYIINDYFDTRIDAINKPDKVIVGNSISKKTASIAHQVTTGLGLLMGLWVAYQCKSMTLALIIAIVPGMLWFYSASYKRQFLIGNIVVAINTALVPLVIITASAAFLTLPDSYGALINQTPVIKIMYGWVIGFVVFAFIMTLIREIIKDMEDENGDKEMESRTMPIVWGITKTKLFLYALIAITLGLAFFSNAKYIDSFPLFGTEKTSLTLRYFIFGLGLPFAYLVYLLIKAKTPKDFHQASTFTKFIMLIGTLYCFIFYFLIAKAQGIPMFDLFLVK